MGECISPLWFVPTNAPTLFEDGNVATAPPTPFAEIEPTSQPPTDSPVVSIKATLPPAPDAPTIPDGLVFECVADCVDKPSPGNTVGWTSLGPCYADTEKPCVYAAYDENVVYVSGDKVTVKPIVTVVTPPPAPDAPTLPNGLVFECVADCVDKPSPGETSGWTSLGPCYKGTEKPCAPLYVQMRSMSRAIR